MRQRSVAVLAWALLLVASSFPYQPQADRKTAARDQQVAQAAEALKQRLIDQRRDFHMHPELSNREERTARVVAERLGALGLEEIKTGVGKHGVTALL
ncbi:MAG TPA: amidohydrolase, partial [Blastocatellia bacterium]|nr:amidohydrolase [Blastocatellia bacterium]